MTTIRVLVAEDSLTVRKRLVELLSSDPDIQVVGEAEDGKTAIELCAALRPDVVTLDMMMPVLSGLAVTEYVMAYCPTPILIVSSSTNRRELFQTYEALSAGALDVMDKPPGDDTDETWQRRLLSTVKLISRVKVITHPRARLGPASAALPEMRRATVGASPHSSTHYQLLALGASTGGPGAILQILNALNKDFPIPILVVLHLATTFADSFAEWLDGNTAHEVNYAREGQSLNTQGVFLAPPGRHLLIQDARLHLSEDDERNFCKPSVDVLFESIACECGPRAAACLLTGMGRDGAMGLLKIRRSGGFTIAQDETTSVVYGMPREAMLLGAAARILPLGEIGSTLDTLVRPARSAMQP